MLLIIKNFLDEVEKVYRFLIVVCLLVIVSDVFVGVIARYVFNSSFTWTEELGVLFYTWLIFIGFPLGLKFSSMKKEFYYIKFLLKLDCLFLDLRGIQ